MFVINNFKSLKMTNENLTFDLLPKMVAEMNRKLDLLLSGNEQPQTKEKALMTIEELQQYLPDKPARPTIYQWVNNHQIPFEKFGGRRLWFRKVDIDNWQSNGRKIT